MPRILVDTNLLLRIADPGARQNQPAADAVASLLAAGHEACICPQNIIEFWAVATRPISANGLGWSIARTDQEVTEMAAHFVMLPDTREYLEPGEASSQPALSPASASTMPIPPPLPASINVMPF